MLDPSGKSINDFPFADWNPIPVTEKFFFSFLYQIRPELPIFWHTV